MEYSRQAITAGLCRSRWHHRVLEAAMDEITRRQIMAARERETNRAVMTTDDAAEHAAPPLPNSVFKDVGAPTRAPLPGTTQPEGQVPSDLQGEQ